MSYDITECIDEYCRCQVGHTNWAWKSTMSKEEIEKNIKDDTGYLEGDVFLFFDEWNEEEQ